MQVLALLRDHTGHAALWITRSGLGADGPQIASIKPCWNQRNARDHAEQHRGPNQIIINIHDSHRQATGYSDDQGRRNRADTSL